MRGFTIIIISWLVFSTACDPCDNCGEPLIYEPTVALVFINTDTLGKLTGQLDIITDSLGRTSDKKSIADDKLDSLESRLIVVNDSIAKGYSSYQSEKADLENLIADYIDSLSYYATLINKIDSVSDFLTDIKKDVLNGLLMIDTLYINSQYLTYEDSAEIYDAPLLMNEDEFTQFEVIIGDFKGEVSFEYSLREFVDATREIKLRAFDILPADYVGFDSIEGPSCLTTQCRDGETTVYLYFH
ncbi:MAG: hypothetical protein ACFHWX_10595 [Bacteroidota bacterium]